MPSHHGNSKKNNQPFYRTEPETLKSIDQFIADKKHSPRQIFRHMVHQQGGAVGVSSIDCIPRNLEQIYNKSSKPQGKDDVFAIIEICKNETSKPNTFIYKVEASPSLNIVIGYDHMFQDIGRFCTDVRNHCVLSIDTTFGCGDFYITPLCYQNLILCHGRTSVSPIQMGPVLLHHKKDTDAFSFLFAKVIDKVASAKSIICVGRDDDQAIKVAISRHFPNVHQVICRKHVEDCLRHHLSELNIKKGTLLHTFIKDIFGTLTDFGLADHANPEAFVNALSSIKPKWDNMEEDHTGKPPKFHQWFVRYHRKQFQQFFLANVHHNAGLGFQYYFNNISESLNSLIRIEEKTDRSIRDIPNFINNTLRTIADEQRVNAQLAVFGQGPYRLKNEFKHLFVPGHEWSNMSEERRARHLNNLYTLVPGTVFTHTDMVPRPTAATTTEI